MLCYQLQFDKRIHAILLEYWMIRKDFVKYIL